MPLQRGGIAVRPHEPGDALPLHAAALESVAEVGPRLSWCHAGLTPQELAAFIDQSRRGWADGSQFQFAIVDAQTGDVLGGISLAHIARANRLANMGYWVRTSATGRGVATTAIRLVAGFGFDEVGLTRIEIAAVPDNVASRRAAERAGAKFEAVVRNRLVVQGTAFAAALYSLVPEDLDDRS